MENQYFDIGLIKHQGISGSSIKGDILFPVIATKDIAHIAYEYLSELGFTGKTVRELLGPRDMSMTEMTKIIGEAIGKPDLPYVEFSYEDAEKGAVDAGLSPDMARLYAEMNKSLNEGIGITAAERTPENTTPTTFEELAQVFAAVYSQ